MTTAVLPDVPMVESTIDDYDQCCEPVADAIRAQLDLRTSWDRSPYDGHVHQVLQDTDQRVVLDLTDSYHIPVELTGDGDDDHVRVCWSAKIDSAKRVGVRVVATYRVAVKLA